VRCGIVCAALVAALLSACAPQAPTLVRPEAPGPASFPEVYYRQAIERREAVFRVDPERSVVVIEVRRGGSLARLGHDHVVASHDVRGYVAPDAHRADLYVALDRLVVDESRLRREAGFDTEPSASDVAGTRQNMLEKVLEADRYPYALVSVTGVDAGATGAGLDVAITLHGATRAFRIPAKIETAADATDVTGQLAFDQSEFGITPFSILGGAVQVQDKVNLRFHIHARRIGA